MRAILNNEAKSYIEVGYTRVSMAILLPCLLKFDKMIERFSCSGMTFHDHKVFQKMKFISTILFGM